MIKLFVNEIEDGIIRDNFRRLQKELTETQIILKGQWRFVELTFEAAVTNFKYPHKLNFVPKDVIQTATSGAMAVIWNYDLFDRTNIDITTSEGGTVRAFIGSYAESEGQL